MKLDKYNKLIGTGDFIFITTEQEKLICRILEGYDYRDECWELHLLGEEITSLGDTPIDLNNYSSEQLEIIDEEIAMNYLEAE